ncbi:MAG: dihydroorotase [Saprospiraceae bacterium]|nr:dihydroorotase [Saprospiraceae bacterium]
MKHLIKNCTIIHKGSKYHNKNVDILVDNGIISKIASRISDAKATLVQGKNLHASIGWMDIGTHLGEPGYEHRETFESLSNAAKAGGYTDLVTMPKSIPAVQSKAQIKSLINMGQSLGVDIHPLGALSQNLEGDSIAELVDMNHAGAVGFTDGLTSVDKSGLLLRALQYVKQFDGIILHHPNDSTLSNDDLIHEGIVSTSLGMKGSPSLAEILITYRDVRLQEYTESRLCMHLIGTKESVDIIKKAKKTTDKLVSGVSFMNLIHSDDDLSEFDSNLKVKPILRDKTDQKSLRKGVTDDTIDYISSNHYPLEVEKKHLEFPYASHGAIGLETCFAALNSKKSKDLDLDTIVHKISIGPRLAMRMQVPTLEKGVHAKITVFDPNQEWQYTNTSVQSLSRNSPYIDAHLRGKIVATFNGKSVFISN